MKLPRPIYNAYSLLKDVFHDYSEDNGSMVAAAISFYLFLSFIPLILLAIAAFGFVLRSPEQAQEFVLSFTRDYPGISESGDINIMNVIREVISGRGSATLIGTLLLLWTGTSVIANMEQAINVAWDADQPRGYIKRRLVGLGLLILIGLLLSVSVGATALLRTLQQVSVFGVQPGEWPVIWDVLGYLVPLGITIIAFTLIYKILPNTFVRWRIAFAGGVFAGLLWEAAKIAFSFYLSHFANYSAVYGSIAAVILFLVWIYYSSIIIVIGAEFTSVWNRRHPGRDRQE